MPTPSVEPGRTDTRLQERLSGNEPPSMVVNGEHRILHWNLGAERLFGITKREALGRRCHELLAGRDAFGNRICLAACAPCAMLRSGENVEPFEMSVPLAPHEDQDLHLSTTIARCQKWEDLFVHTFSLASKAVIAAERQPSCRTDGDSLSPSRAARPTVAGSAAG